MRLALAVAMLLGLALVPGTGAVTPPANLPDLSQMALRVTDLPAGAKVSKQHYVKPDGALAEYDREFKSGTARVGKTRLLDLENDIEIHRSADEAAFNFDQFRAIVSSKKGRQGFARLFARELASSSPFGKTKVTAGKPLVLGTGDDSIALPFAVQTPLGTIRVVIGLHRTDRVLSFLVMVGGFEAPLPTSAARTVAKPISQHMRDGLVPINAVVPTIAGTAQVGQTLTATAGTWKNTPTVAYQWQRCDSAGANCVPIPGAATLTYVLQATDVGATLRVAETATNTIGSATATSLQTAAVIP